MLFSYAYFTISISFLSNSFPPCNIIPFAIFIDCKFGFIPIGIPFDLLILSDISSYVYSILFPLFSFSFLFIIPIIIFILNYILYNKKNN